LSEGVADEDAIDGVALIDRNESGPVVLYVGAPDEKVKL
jgi:hypothetical protein